MPAQLRIGLMLFLCALQTAALGASPSQQTKLAKVMELYGLTTLIDHIPQDVIDDFSQDDYLERQNLSQDQVNTLKQVVTTNFAADRIRKDAVKQLTSDYDAARIDAVIAQLSSPLYRKITALEQQANSPEAASDLQEYVARLALHNPDPKRLELMKALDRASHSTKIAVSIELEIAKTMIRCAAAYSDDGEPLPESRLKDIVARLKGTITHSVRNHILIWSLYAYRSLSRRELQDYIAIYENDDIRWFTRTSSRALIDALDHASTRSARDIARLRNALHI